MEAEHAGSPGHSLGLSVSQNAGSIKSVITVTGTIPPPSEDPVHSLFQVVPNSSDQALHKAPPCRSIASWKVVSSTVLALWQAELCDSAKAAGL